MFCFYPANFSEQTVHTFMHLGRGVHSACFVVLCLHQKTLTLWTSLLGI